MTDMRERLEGRKRELFDAIRLLEQDREDGVMDEAAYATARRRYELEAAKVIERLDRLAPTEPMEHAPRERTSRSPLWIAGPAAAIIGVALVLFLFAGLQHRTEAQPIGSVPTVSPAVLAAQRNASAHPRSVDAQLALGNAYFDVGQLTQADVAYQTAIGLAPARPEARTLHAMVLASDGKDARALAQLSQVERAQPRYARAWLLDGLIASKSRAGYSRAIAAWKRFLTLQPRSAVAPSVRRWMADLQKKSKR